MKGRNSFIQYKNCLFLNTSVILTVKVHVETEARERDTLRHISVASRRSKAKNQGAISVLCPLSFRQNFGNHVSSDTLNQ